MSDARWNDVAVDVMDACKHFGNARAIFDRAGFNREGLDGYILEMALLHALQSGHTSMEGALLRILDILGEDRPTGEGLDQELIRIVANPLTGWTARPAILTPESAADADETRRFRNEALRGYEDFDVSQAGFAIAAAHRLSETLLRDVAQFLEAVDPSKDIPLEDILAGKYFQP